MATRSIDDDEPSFHVEAAANMALALMALNIHGDKYGMRAWKSFPWELLDNLHERGLISNPARPAKSVALSPEGEQLAYELFKKHFQR